MPLISCPDCGKQVSTEAIACPGCGRPVRHTEPAGAGPTNTGHLPAAARQEQSASMLRERSQNALLGLAAVGVLVGGFIGFLARPNIPLLGQLPFSVVISRGVSLTGFDQVLVPTAQSSFNIMLMGALVGGICGVILAKLLFPSGRSSPAVLSSDSSVTVAGCPDETWEVATKEMYLKASTAELRQSLNVLTNTPGESASAAANLIREELQRRENAGSV